MLPHRMHIVSHAYHHDDLIGVTNVLSNRTAMDKISLDHPLITAELTPHSLPCTIVSV